MRKDKEDTSVSNFHGCPFKYRARKQLELNFWRLTDSFVIHIIPLMLNLSTRWHTFTYLFNSSEVFHGHSFITIGSHCELCDISAKFSLDLPWKKKKSQNVQRGAYETQYCKLSSFWRDRKTYMNGLFL